MKKRGFTLTEVLIALSIIGVIAAMTIPNLMISVGNSKTKTQLMKFLADMEQAVALYEYNGGSWAGAVANTAVLKNAFSTVLKSTDSGTKVASIVYPDGSTPFSTNMNYIKLKSGAEIFFYATTAACNRYGQDCSEIVIDMNGQGQTPNKFGSDVFEFAIIKNTSNSSYSVVPLGSQTGHTINPVTDPYRRCSGGSARACAHEILADLKY
jgi:prepilin-type N-terminal cleavage/methylation domain-containing protein